MLLNPNVGLSFDAPREGNSQTISAALEPFDPIPFKVGS